MSTFLNISTHEFGAPPVTDVHSDGLGLAQLEVAILDVGDIGELSAKVFFLSKPSVYGLTEEVSVLEVNSGIVEDMSVDVATGGCPHFPVSEYGFILCHL